MSQPAPTPTWVIATPDASALLIRIKAVPGAKRNEIAGALGDGARSRLKIRISAPPEDGKANKAICELIAGALGLKRRAVSLVSGHSSAEKTLRVERIDAERVVQLLA